MKRELRAAAGRPRVSDKELPATATMTAPRGGTVVSTRRVSWVAVRRVPGSCARPAISQRGAFGCLLAPGEHGPAGAGQERRQPGDGDARGEKMNDQRAHQSYSSQSCLWGTYSVTT